MPDDDGRITQALKLRARHVAQTKDNPESYAATILRNDAIERWPACAEFLSEHPEATAQEIATRVLGMSELDVFKLLREAG